MKLKFLKRTAAAALACLLGASSLQAIKITIPDQYEEEVEAIKKAEKAEVERRIDAAESAKSQSEADVGDEAAVHNGTLIQPQNMANKSAGENGPDRTSDENAKDRETPVSESTLRNTDINTSEDLAEGDGRIVGQVYDKETGAPIRGVAILIEDTDFGTVTDVDGRFRFSDVLVGEYVLSFAKTGYIESSVTGTSVTAGEVSKLNFGMPPRPAEMSDDVYELQDFTVTAEEALSQSVALDLQRQQSAASLNIIGSSDFSRFGVDNAAEALQRVVGVSIAEGKFAVIRGLSDRYAPTLVNGLTVPSPDPRKQSVQLDLFPSDLLESVVTQKSFTADQPGNASGGSIDLQTLDLPEEFFLSVSFGLGYDSQATGNEDFASDAQNGGIEFFADEVDEYPDFETTRTGRPSDRGENLSIISSDTPGFDTSFSATLGNTFDIFDDKPLGFVLGLTQERSFDYKESERNRFRDISSGTPGLEDDQVGNEVTSTESVVFGALAALTFLPSEDHELSVDVFHSRTGEIEISEIQTWDQSKDAILGTNDNPRSSGFVGFDSPDYQRILRQSQIYTERFLTIFEFGGKSLFPEFWDIEADWGFNIAETGQDQPDARQIEISEDPNDPNPRSRFFLVSPTNSQSVRSYRTIMEDHQNARLDLTKPFDFMGEKASFSVGASYETKENETEQFSVFSSGPSVDPIPAGFPNGPEVLAFLSIADQGLTGESVGERTIRGGYSEFEVPLWESLRLTAGLRAESTEQNVSGFGDDPSVAGIGEIRGEGEIEQTDLLPSLNLVYELNESVKLRGSASKTVARPSFRELNPTIIREAVGGDQIRGNPELQLSSVTNFDFRVDYYNETGDFASLSLFLKKVEEPIEQTVEAERITFKNNPNTATLRGVELEVRKSLDFMSLDYFTIGANATYIDAEVDRPTEEFESVSIVLGEPANRTRRLEDQPEWIFNADIRFEHPDWGTDATLALFWISDRLDVAAGTSPRNRDLDRFEQSYHTLDFSIAQKIRENWTVKFSAKNLTDSAREVLYDPDLTDEELVYSRHRNGRSYSLSVSYDF